MQTFTIKFNISSNWEELGDNLLRYAYELIAGDYSADEMKLFCLLHWRHKGRCPSRQRRILLHNGKMLFEATSLILAELLPHLDWLVAVPTSPVRLSKINR